MTQPSHLPRRSWLAAAIDSVTGAGRRLRAADAALAEQHRQLGELHRLLKALDQRLLMLTEFSRTLRAPCGRCGQLSKSWTARPATPEGHLVAICRDCQRAAV